MKSYIEEAMDELSHAGGKAMASVRQISTPSAMAKKTFFYAQEAGILRCFEANKSYRESLDSYLMVFVMSGIGTFTYGGKEFPAHAGSCFLVDCRYPLTHECCEEDPWEFIWVHFNGKLCQEYYDYFRTVSDVLFYSHSCYRIGEIMKEILVLLKEKTEFYEIEVNLRLTELFTLVITTAQSEEIYSKNTSVDDKLHEVIRYIGAHYTENITLDSISEQFFISKYYLSRRFKRKYGEGINAYLTRIRLDRAKELLRFSDNQIAEISQKSGFRDVCYFNKIFKQSEQISPAEFRQRWQEY